MTQFEPPFGEIKRLIESPSNITASLPIIRPTSMQLYSRSVLLWGWNERFNKEQQDLDVGYQIISPWDGNDIPFFPLPNNRG